MEEKKKKDPQVIRTAHAGEHTTARKLSWCQPQPRQPARAALSLSALATRGWWAGNKLAQDKSDTLEHNIATHKALKKRIRMERKRASRAVDLAHARGDLNSGNQAHE